MVSYSICPPRQRGPSRETPLYALTFTTISQNLYQIAYIKGATLDPSVRTINVPRKVRKTIIGRSQNFLRSFRKSHSSNKNSPMSIPLCQNCLCICEPFRGNRVTRYVGVSESNRRRIGSLPTIRMSHPKGVKIP